MWHVQALLDSYLCFVHLAAAMYMEPLFHAFLVTALFEFVIFSLFEMRFLLSIWKALRPDAFANGFEVMRREFSRLYVRFCEFCTCRVPYAVSAVSFACV